MTDADPAAPGLGEEPPEIDGDKGEGADQGGDRDHPEDQDPVFGKEQGEGEQQTGDRARGAEGVDVRDCP